jgi:hypothetical protein
MDGQEIAFIVERLRLPPFDLDIDLVSLDEKSAPELLDILSALLRSSTSKPAPRSLQTSHPTLHCESWSC